MRHVLTTIFLGLTLGGVYRAQTADPGLDVQELDRIVKRGVTETSLKAILEAGRSGKKVYRGYLRQVSEQPHQDLEVKTLPAYAEIALAMLGDKKYTNRILKQVDDANIFVQDAAIEKLGLLGGRTAYRKFRRLLDDLDYRREIPSDDELSRARKGGYSVRKGDQLLEPRSFVVMKVLARIAQDPPVGLHASPTPQDITLWKTWFERHPELLR